MDDWLYTLILLTLSAIWLWLRHNANVISSNKHIKSAPTKAPIKTYHGVTIHPCSNPCEAVQNLNKKRFLANDVTTLPVMGCTSKVCTCHYVHHEDRRNEDNRRYPSIIMDGVFSQKEHRQRKERRKHHFA